MLTHDSTVSRNFLHKYVERGKIVEKGMQTNPLCRENIVSKLKENIPLREGIYNAWFVARYAKVRLLDTVYH